MRCDCGHKAEIGRLHRRGLFCLACSYVGAIRGVVTSRQDTLQKCRVAQATELKVAFDLIKKRLPSDWPDDKLEKIARRMIRAKT